MTPVAEKVHDKAYDIGQMSAAGTMVKEISILTGHRVERSEIGAPGDFDHLNDDELECLLIER